VNDFFQSFQQLPQFFSNFFSDLFSNSSLERSWIVLILLLVFLFLFMYSLSSPVSRIHLRHLPALDKLDQVLAQCAETGNGVHFSLGTAGLVRPAEHLDRTQTLAALEVLAYTAKRTAAFDLPLLVTVDDPALLSRVTALTRLVYKDSGQLRRWRKVSVRYLSDSSGAYAAGVLEILNQNDVKVNILIGSYGDEALLLAEKGHQAGMSQVIGSASPGQLPFLVLVEGEKVLLGSQIYAAGAYLSRYPLGVQSLRAADFFLLILVFVILIGVIAASAGLDVGGLLVSWP